MPDTTQNPPAPPAPVLQDWAPLTHCLDWHLGQLAFQHRGAQAFTTNEVPNLVNQGGMSAYRAAEVLFANCAEAEAAGTLLDDEGEIVCMELAIGLGLYSVQLLDRFKERCEAAKKDWYDKLRWFATDATPKMLTDAAANGVFERHAERVVLAQVDALQPSIVHPFGGDESVAPIDLTGRIRGVFHSYLLCVLPANVFRRTTKADKSVDWSVLMARTVLRHPDAVSQFSNLTVDGVKALAASRAAEDLLRIVSLYPLIDLDLTLAPLAADAHDDRAELDRIADLIEADLQAEAADESEDAATHTWVLHSAGAMVSVASTLNALRPDGFLLYRDYGSATAKSANNSHLYQHYGATTAIGVNHYALDTWVASPPSAVVEIAKPVGQVSAPNDEGEASIKTRLVSVGDIPGTREAFQEHFSRDAFVGLQQAVDTARKARQTPTECMEGYRKALVMERDNWVLLTEAADYALRQAQNLEMARMLVAEALRINPWYGAQAWNCLGDVHWFSGRLDASEACFERATRANPEHFKGWYNLHLVHRQRGDFAQAVQLAAKALALDSAGADTKRLEAALKDATERLEKQRTQAQKWRKKRAAGSPT
ncbi:MAG: tetratricopeptide repeat protein [Myxococcales bacterium]|nr:tetratricopeptide repeat protein [Myxococcales bacterium]